MILQDEKINKRTVLFFIHSLFEWPSEKKTILEEDWGIN